MMKKSLMKKLKKAVVLTLTVALAVSAVSGCGKKKENRLEAIQKAGKLQVICEPYFAPYEFIDSSKTGQDQYLGADMELARYIAKQLGVELEIVPLEWTAVLTGISTGKYDMAISGMAYTPERAESMALSDSYRDSASKHGFVVKASDVSKYPSLDSFNGKKIAYQKGTLQEMYATQQIKDLGKNPFDSVQNAILALQSGKVDAVAVSYDNGELFVNANSDLAMATPLFKGTEDHTVVACPKGQTELIKEVNKIIADVKAQGLYQQWWDEATEQAKTLGVSQ